MYYLCYYMGSCLYCMCLHTKARPTCPSAALRSSSPPSGATTGSQKCLWEAPAPEVSSHETNNCTCDERSFRQAATYITYQAGACAPGRPEAGPASQGVPGRAFFPNLSKIITFAAAPLVLTPFVRNQHYYYYYYDYYYYYYYDKYYYYHVYYGYYYYYYYYSNDNDVDNNSYYYYLSPKDVRARRACWPAAGSCRAATPGSRGN